MSDTCGFDLFPPRDVMEDYLDNLQEVNLQLAEFKKIKEHLERKILETMGAAKFDEKGNVTSVEHDGSSTKYIGRYKAVVKTPSLWKIDKGEYQAVAGRIRDEFNPVVESISYRVSNEKLRMINTYGSAEDKTLVGQFLILDYSKPSITLSLNV